MKKANWILIIWDYYYNVLYKHAFYSKKQAKYIMATGKHGLIEYWKHNIYKGV